MSRLNARSSGSDLQRARSDSFKTGVVNLERWLNRTIEIDPSSTPPSRGGSFLVGQRSASLPAPHHPQRPPGPQETSAEQNPASPDHHETIWKPTRAIPTPPQALTILRALKRIPQDQIPPHQHHLLTNVLNNLLDGDSKLFRNLSDSEYHQLDVIVADILLQAPAHFRLTQGRTKIEHSSRDSSPEGNIRFERRHVMLVLRAINMMRKDRFSTKEQRRLKRTKEILFDLSRGRITELNKIARSDSREDQFVRSVISNALLRAHAEISATNPSEQSRR